MKSGTAPSVGVTRNYWHNYVTQCNTNPNQVKKSYTIRLIYFIEQKVYRARFV